MAITENVIVRIMINKGNADTEVEKVGERGQKAFSMWGAQLATIQKALISMTAVIIAWNALVIIPEKLAKGFADLAIISAKAANEMQQSILATAGLLASFVNFGPTVAESFKNAVVVTRQLQGEFVRLAANSVASQQDIMLTFQQVLTNGGLAFVKTEKEAAQLAATLTNIIIPLTGGFQKERQLVSETTGLFQNQANAGNRLVRMIRSIVGDVDLWLQKQKQLGTLNEELTKMFQGLDAASSSLGQTLGGRLENIQGDLKIINELVAGFSGSFKLVLDITSRWSQLLDKAVVEVTRSNVGFLVLSETTQDIIDAFFKFSAAVEQILLGFKAILDAITGTNSETKALNNIMDTTLDIAVRIRMILVNLSTVIAFVREHWQDMIPPMFRVAAKIWDMVLGSNKLRESLDTRIKNEEELLIKQMAQEAAAAKKAEQERKIKDILEDQAKLREKALEGLLKLHNELDKIIVAENPLAKVALEFDQRIVEAKKDFKDFPSMLQEAVGLLQQMKNIEVFRAMRDDLLKVIKDTELPMQELLKNIHLLQGSTIETQAPPVQDFFPEDSIERGKQFLRISQNAIEIAHRWMQQLDILANQGLLNFDFAMQGTNKQMDTIRQQIESLVPVLNELKLAKDLVGAGALPPEMLPDLDRQISEIETQMESLQQVFGSLDEQIKQLILNFDPAAAAFNNFVLQLRIGVTVMTNMLNALKASIASIPNAFAEALSAMIVGGESFIQAFRKAIAKTIEAIGIEMIAWGMRSIVQGIWPFNPAALAAGAKQIAMGTAVLGLARLVGGSAKAAPGAAASSASSSRERQTVIFQPTLNNTGQNMQQTLTRLTETIEQLRGVPAGQVIVQGAQSNEGAAAIAMATSKAANTDSRFRRNLSDAVLGNT